VTSVLVNNTLGFRVPSALVNITYIPTLANFSLVLRSQENQVKAKKHIPLIILYTIVYIDLAIPYSYPYSPLFTHPFTRTYKRFIIINFSKVLFKFGLVITFARLSWPLIHQIFISSLLLYN
jgi:hypothetical protein